jgi:hypothetical protein
MWGNLERNRNLQRTEVGTGDTGDPQGYRKFLKEFIVAVVFKK